MLAYFISSFGYIMDLQSRTLPSCFLSVVSRKYKKERQTGRVTQVWARHSSPRWVYSALGCAILLNYSVHELYQAVRALTRLGLIISYSGGLEMTEAPASGK